MTSRREFMALAASTLVAAGLPACALFLHKARPDATLTAENGSVRVPAALLPGAAGRGPAVVLAVTGSDDKLLLLRGPDGKLVALSTVCTHRGCDVEFSAAAGHIVCPCHGSEYDLRGEVLQGPARHPLRAYPLRMDGGNAVITLAG